MTENSEPSETKPTTDLFYLPFKCPHCPKLLSSKPIMDRHVYIAHANIILAEKNKFPGKVCPKCSKEFCNHSYMLKHLPNCNGKANALECEFCNKICSNYMSKSRHMQICIVKEKVEMIDDLRKQQEHLKNAAAAKPAGKKAALIARLNSQERPTVLYNGDETEFVFDHITPEIYREMFSEMTEFMAFFVAFIPLLFQNKANRCIRKIIKTGSEIEVYTADGWKSSNVTANALMIMFADAISNYLDSIKRNKNYVTNYYAHKHFIQMADFIAGESCNHDILVNAYNQCRRALPKRLLNIIFTLTHEMKE